ncbi:MAG: Hsp20/alpha crystallin family protein [Actinomycetota bacterium]
MWDIVRWDPFRDVVAMRQEMDRLLGRFAGGGGGTVGAPWSPASDVIETDDAVVITAELPGVKDEDVEILVEDGMLVVRGERRLEDEIREDRYHRLERSYGSFERRFRLPEGVKEEDITAAVAYGVLRVTLPKPKAAEPRRIPLQSS